jgi:hypothetical protein
MEGKYLSRHQEHKSHTLNKIRAENPIDRPAEGLKKHISLTTKQEIICRIINTVYTICKHQRVKYIATKLNNNWKHLLTKMRQRALASSVEERCPQIGSASITLL